MEAVPRLPMISFELKVSPEHVQFGPQLKQYIASFYNEDPESYNTEIGNLEALRAAAVRPTNDVEGSQLMKKYYCQLHFLKSRFPMGEMQAAAVYFSWKDKNTNMPCSVPDIRFEMMCILYNIGALHTQLGAMDARTSPEGLKMACTHFQCAAWAFQTVKETYYQMVQYISSIEVIHFMQQVCFAQAQECILEKSMMDNRKATIIAKVAVQVVDHYKRALMLLTFGDDDSCFNGIIESRTAKEWTKYLSFKVAYHKCIALLFQGQQAEEQQKMGERVAFYQAACEQLDEARKLSSGLKQQKDLNEAIAFTSDVVEGKRKAAKNENEFIYHEEVPDKHALQEVKGASLVKGIAFSVNDVEVSGPDIFARLVPMEAHEASSLYSEKKAQKLRQLGELVECKDQALAEFMSSLQLDVFTQMRQATGLSQELIDRAAALSAKPTATQDLVAAMGKLSNSYHEVESMLNEIQELLKEEEQSEKEYQELMGKRPPGIIATDLAREAAKYREAHNKANDSNQNLHKAMTTHVANLKILANPLRELQKLIPSVELPNPNVDENNIREVEHLIAKVEEMRNQRSMLWTQFREAVHKDDITSVLVTRQADQPLDQLFQQELQKHQELTSLIEQNVAAQENIMKAFVETYARSKPTRQYLQEIINKRNATVSALIASFDSYEDLMAKANKGIDFYNKLETNVSKLLQRIKSASKVQQEEREQMLLKNSVPVVTTKDEIITPAPKLKDFIDTRKKATRYPEVTPAAPQFYPPQSMPDTQTWPPAVRPAPLGSEVNSDPIVNKPQEQSMDRSLMDRMANLRVAANQYANYTPTTNYSQSVASPNPNKQAYTITTDMYQPISSAAPKTQFAQDPNAHMYAVGTQYSYPTNYGQVTETNQPGYGQENQTAVNYNQQMGYPMNYQTGHGYQAANYQNSTVNRSQINQPDPQANPGYNQFTQPGAPSNSAAYYNQTGPQGAAANYSQTGQSEINAQAVANYAVQPGTNYAQVNQPDPATNYSQFDQQSKQNQAAYYNQTGAVASYTPIGQPGAGVQAAASASYNQAVQPAANYNQVGQTAPTAVSKYQVPNQGNVYYPTGYGPSPAQAASDSNYNYPSTFGSSEYATSVHMNVPTPNCSSTYTAPISDLKTSQSGSSNYAISNGHGYTSYDTNQYQYYYQYPGYGGGYSYVAPPTASVADSSVPVTTKESNVDLLTGLDFTLSQAPLIPQQKPSISEGKSEQKTESPKPVVQSKDEVVAPSVVPEKVINRKPLNNAEVKKLFLQEVDKFEKFVDVLTNKTLSGPTNLDLKWKEIQDKQEGDKKAISVARCYPMKNRYPDILPYDYSRVELKAAKDDYINASYIKDVSYYAAPFIVTQAPLSSTIGDFWTMVKEQQVELIVSLLGDAETGPDTYWPPEKGHDLALSGMIISLVNITVKPHWVERLISISIPEKRDSRVLMHLQFTSWPGSLFPTTPDPFATFVTEVINQFLQQRSTGHPIVVHCSSGIGRSGLVCLLVSAILEITSNPVALPDLVNLTVKLSAWRRNILRDREHLKFAYEAFLAYMKQVIAQGRAKRILNEGGVVGREDSVVPVETKQAIVEDPLSSLDPFWASKKN